MIYQESGIEIDLTASASCAKHDASNNVWPGVDFAIEDSTDWIWLEIKNWEPSGLPSQRRGGQRWSFLCKLKSGVFYREVLRAKFIGTSAFLALTNNHPRATIRYIVLLESPRLDAAMKLHATNRLRSLIPRRGPWTHPVEVAVVDLADWNRLYPQYPARQV